jgi:hypothetical protein
MTEIELPKVIVSEEYQLALNGAKICVEKMQLASLSQDHVKALSAASESLGFYDRCLKLIRKSLNEVDNKKSKIIK